MEKLPLSLNTGIDVPGCTWMYNLFFNTVFLKNMSLSLLCSFTIYLFVKSTYFNLVVLQSSVLYFSLHCIQCTSIYWNSVTFSFYLWISYFAKEKHREILIEWYCWLCLGIVGLLSFFHLEPARNIGER